MDSQINNTDSDHAAFPTDAVAHRHDLTGIEPDDSVRAEMITRFRKTFEGEQSNE